MFVVEDTYSSSDNNPDGDKSVISVPFSANTTGHDQSSEFRTMVSVHKFVISLNWGKRKPGIKIVTCKGLPNRPLKVKKYTTKYDASEWPDSPEHNEDKNCPRLSLLSSINASKEKGWNKQVVASE